MAPAPGPAAQGISGTVVDHATGNPVGGANVVIEQPDSNGIDRIVGSTTTDPNGSFDFSGFPMGMFDVVADASVTSPGGATSTYGATVVFHVPSNASLGKVPLVPEFGDSIPTGQPVHVDAVVATSSATAMLPEVDIKLSALQTASRDDGTFLSVSIPVFNGSTPEVTTTAAQSCPSGTSCSNYSLLVPSASPITGTFQAGGVTYSFPASNPAEVLFVVEGRAFVRISGNAPDCSPSSQSSGPVVPRGTLPTVIPNLAFTSCQ
jgi:hypothetical protein